MREQNYSPEPIRDALWKLTYQDIKGAVLDAGSGAGEWIARLKTLPAINRIISVDLNKDWAERGGVEAYQCDLAKDALPLQDDSLDWVFALEVIEHIAHPRHFVQEAARVLKRGGRLALTTPCNESLTAKLSFLFRGYFPAFCEHDYQLTGHISPVTELDVRRMAQEAGFSHVRFDYSLPGRIPKLDTEWQTVVPFLRGKTWSDSLIAILTY